MAKVFSTIKKIGGTGIGAVVGVMMPISTYKQERQEGHGVLTSAAKSIAETAFYMSPIGDKLAVAQMVGAAAKGVLNAGFATGKISSQQYNAQFGGNFQLSQNGYTMRQRGMQAIESANALRGQTLGNEARSYHRGHFYL